MTGLLHIVLARKPIEGTIAENCLQWGCGALWIDGTRVVANDGTTTARCPSSNANSTTYAQDDYTKKMLRGGNGSNIGRFPANLILGGEEVVSGFPQCDGAVSNGRKGARGACYGEYGSLPQVVGRGDSGSASRFFFNFSEQEADE